MEPGYVVVDKEGNDGDDIQDINLDDMQPVPCAPTTNSAGINLTMDEAGAPSDDASKMSSRGDKLPAADPMKSKRKGGGGAKKKAKAGDKTGGSPSESPAPSPATSLSAAAPKPELKKEESVLLE